jgi:hypothetical protein
MLGLRKGHLHCWSNCSIMPPISRCSNVWQDFFDRKMHRRLLWTDPDACGARQVSYTESTPLISDSSLITTTGINRVYWVNGQ